MKPTYLPIYHRRARRLHQLGVLILATAVLVGLLADIL